MSKQWDEIKNRLSLLLDTSTQDEIFWGLGSKKHFTTRSVYELLEANLHGCDYRWIWGAKIPLKIQIFLWQIHQDATLTRDALKKGNGKGILNAPFVLSINL